MREKTLCSVFMACGIESNVGALHIYNFTSVKNKIKFTVRTRVEYCVTMCTILSNYSYSIDTL